MKTRFPNSAIAKLVKAHQTDDTPGATALARKTGILREQIDTWVRRGWATPYRFPELAPHLLSGITVEQLHADRAKAKQPERRRADRRQADRRTGA
jgi:hypothetical protein